MTHRDSHRGSPHPHDLHGRNPVRTSPSGVRTRSLSPLLLRLLFTVLALLAWVLWVMPALAQEPTPSTTTATAIPESHTVQSGETLSEIAKQHGLVIEQLMRLNGIPNPDAIFVGQVLRLPVSNRPEGVVVHVVRSGESLSVIARQYGVPMRDLMDENGIRNANNIVSGMELVIPTLSATPTAAATTPAPEITIIGEPEVMSVHTRTPIVVPTSTPFPTATPTSIPTTSIPTSDVAIPSAPTTEQAGAETSPSGPIPDSTLESGLWVHVVRPGETASEIAKEYGVGLSNLLRANGIANANLIRSGAELVIPGSAGWTPGSASVAVIATATAVEMTSTPAVEGEPVIMEAMTPTPADPSTPVPVEQQSIVNPTPTPAVAQEAIEASPVAAPAITAPNAVVSVAPLSDRPAASLNRTYTIVSGDTLPRIALRFGIDVESLRRLNNLEDGTGLRAGNSLLLPATDRELRVVSEAREYVVQPGDSLSAIAKQNGVTLAELMTANRIVNPNIVSVGERLEIPGRALFGDGPMARVGPARSGYYFYTIRAGDTLSELAQNLNSTEIALMEYNNISDAATIFNGMELRVPFGAPPLPRRTPPVPLSGSAFLVSLSRQQCWVFSGREVRYAWNCSTGYGEWRTRTGSFAVQSKIEMAKSNVWRLDMPYWLGIYDVGAVENGIHGLPISWRTGRKIWTELIGEPATFGCAMLGDDDALTLFTLAYIGMPVHIIQ